LSHIFTEIKMQKKATQKKADRTQWFALAKTIAEVLLVCLGTVLGKPRIPRN
jgi:hypothetical protein